MFSLQPREQQLSQLDSDTQCFSYFRLGNGASSVITDDSLFSSFLATCYRIALLCASPHAIQPKFCALHHWEIARPPSAPEVLRNGRLDQRHTAD